MCCSQMAATCITEGTAMCIFMTSVHVFYRTSTYRLFNKYYYENISLVRQNMEDRCSVAGHTCTDTMYNSHQW